MKFRTCDGRTVFRLRIASAVLTLFFSKGRFAVDGALVKTRMGL